MDRATEQYGKGWWRSLRQLSGEVRAGEREFEPGETEAALAGFDRRTFLKLMGASLALAGATGITGCTKPQAYEKIVPYVDQPEGLIPGVPRFYASALPLGGWGHGVIVEQHEGRPTKIEGNPDHPSSLGATNIYMQASILQLYDPDRLKNLTHVTQGATWGTFLDSLTRFVARKGGAKNLRVRVLTGATTSPTIAWQMGQLREVFPKLVWHQHEAVGRANTQGGLDLAFGKGGGGVTAVYDFLKAKRIVSLDSHFLADDPGSVRYAREFAQNRRIPFKAFGPLDESVKGPVAAPTVTAETMSRLYVAESTVTFTGARADHRLPLKGSQIPMVAALIVNPRAEVKLPEEAKKWALAAGEDLRKGGKESLVIVGEHQPAEVHALAHAINGQLGSIGTTVRYVERVDAASQGEGDTSLAGLVEAMNAGEVDLLINVDVNAAYNGHADLKFAEVLQKFSTQPDQNVPERMSVYLGTYADETAELCQWAIPHSHSLEAWGDCRAHEGTASIIQPLIEPLYASKSAVELFAAVLSIGAQSAGAPGGASVSLMMADGYEIVRQYWMERWKGAQGEKEMRWRKALHDGVIPETAAKDVQVKLQRDVQGVAADVMRLANGDTGGVELNLRADPCVGDGYWANNPWLQELPKPLLRFTWDNAAIVSHATAEKYKLRVTDNWDHHARNHHPRIRVKTKHGELNLPVWVQPGQPDDVVTVYLGGGRRTTGRIAEGVGVDVYPVRTRESLWRIGDVEIAKAGGTHQVANVQDHQVMDGRDIVREREVDKLPGPDAPKETPDLYGQADDKDGKKVHLSLYDEYNYPGYKWGMVVDLSACIGCNACVIACQAENNIPCVGKEEVLKSRQMHWMRIDTYYGSEETTSLSEAGANPKMLFQPMFCQQCEDAPCELVCPVEATSHSSEGINEMTYNRCVGTRYCSNNCPYKVRRFNFLLYNDHDIVTWNMQKNPNVTVRSRGVMEKCTYCIQRINEARIDAKKKWSQNDAVGRQTEMRSVASDGWLTPEKLPRIRVQTACQQSCPTEALIFGDMNDTENYVSLLKTKSPWAAIDYGVLVELNTQPRTTYLERIANPNPALKEGAA